MNFINNVDSLINSLHKIFRCVIINKCLCLKQDDEPLFENDAKFKVRPYHSYILCLKEGRATGEK